MLAMAGGIILPVIVIVVFFGEEFQPDFWNAEISASLRRFSLSCQLGR